jgi:hypothetical protein
MEDWSQAMEACEPGQSLTAAAISIVIHVPWGNQSSIQSP